MEKHQILKPQRARGTPFTRFHFKAFSVGAVVCGVILYVFDRTFSEHYLLAIRSGYYEEDESLKKKRFLMSFMSLTPTRSAEELQIDYENTVMNPAHRGMTIAPNIPAEDF